MLSIGVSFVTVIFATHENGAGSVALLEAGAETGRSTDGDDGSKIGKAVVFV